MDYSRDVIVALVLKKDRPMPISRGGIERARLLAKRSRAAVESQCGGEAEFSASRRKAECRHHARAELCAACRSSNSTDVRCDEIKVRENPHRHVNVEVRGALVGAPCE